MGATTRCFGRGLPATVAQNQTSSGVSKAVIDGEEEQLAKISITSLEVVQGE